MADDTYVCAVCRTCAHMSTSRNDNALEEIRCRVSAIVFLSFLFDVSLCSGFFFRFVRMDVPAQFAYCSTRALSSCVFFFTYIRYRVTRALYHQLYMYPTTGSESEHGHNRIILKNERKRE